MGQSMTFKITNLSLCWKKTRVNSKEAILLCSDVVKRLKYKE